MPELVTLDEAAEVPAENRSLREAIDQLSVGLSAAEHKVLELLLDDYTDGEIGALLHIGEEEARRLHASVIEKMRRKAKGRE